MQSTICKFSAVSPEMWWKLRQYRSLFLPCIVAFDIRRFQIYIDFFIMQIFRTWEKYKGNSFKNGRLLVCSGRRKLLEHWATAVTIRVRCPIVRKYFFYLEIILVQFSLHQKNLSSFLSFARLWVMLNYQCDVLLWQQHSGNRMEPLFILWTELNGICVDLSSCVQRARCGFSW